MNALTRLLHRVCSPARRHDQAQSGQSPAGFDRPATVCRAARRAAPRVETLESRDLLAGHLTASFANGVLRVVGTPAADTILVRQNTGRISVAGARIHAAASPGRAAGLVNQLDARSVHRVEAYGLGGNDTIRLDAGRQALRAPGVLDGGAGDDDLVGGAGADTFRVGNAEADHVHGFAANDRLTFTRPDQVLAAGVRSDGAVFVVGKDNVLSVVGRPVESLLKFQTTPDQGCVTLSTDGRVRVNGGAPIRTDAADLAVDALGRLILLDRGGTLTRSRGRLGEGGWDTLAFGVRAFGLADFGMGVCFLTGDGKTSVLDQWGGLSSAYDGGQRIVQLRSYFYGVLTLFDGGGLYFSGDGRNLGSVGGFTYRWADNVRSFGVDRDGVVYVLDQGGNLFRYPTPMLPNKRQLYYTGVQSFSVAADGVTLNVSRPQEDAWQTLPASRIAPNVRALLPAVDLAGGSYQWDPTRWALHAVRPSDVKQRLAGVCTFDSALASAAGRGMDLAGRIRYLGNHVYRVSLWTGDQDVSFDGKVWSTDAAPVVEPVTEVVAGRTVTHYRVTSFWALLYQRAYLQSHGVTDWATDNWQSWIGATWPIFGRPSWMSPKNAIAALVGSRDLNNWDADDPGDDPYENLREQLAQGALVTVETKSTIFFGEVHDAPHQFAVLGMDGSGNVHLYNPWGFTPSDAGYEYWKGDFWVSWTQFTDTFSTFTTGVF